MTNARATGTERMQDPTSAAMIIAKFLTETWWLHQILPASSLGSCHSSRTRNFNCPQREVNIMGFNSISLISNDCHSSLNVQWTSTPCTEKSGTEMQFFSHEINSQYWGKYQKIFSQINLHNMLIHSNGAIHRIRALWLSVTFLVLCFSSVEGVVGPDNVRNACFLDSVNLSTLAARQVLHWEFVTTSLQFRYLDFTYSYFQKNI